MKIYFLEKDFIALEEKIKAKELELIQIGKDIYKATEESSETWHDNFDYEESKRKQGLVANGLNKLIELKKQAVVLEQVKNSDIKSNIGKYILLKNINSEEEKKYFISSFIIMDSKYENEISYNSPLGSAMSGLKVGDIFILDNIDITYEVLEIQEKN